MIGIVDFSIKDQAIRAIGDALVRLSEEQTQGIRDSWRHRLYGMADLARNTGILEARLSYSLEGHIDEVYREKTAPKLRPDAGMEW